MCQAMETGQELNWVHEWKNFTDAEVIAKKANKNEIKISFNITSVCSHITVEISDL